ncbi:MAG: DedA family protein [Calditrichaeota bacterium]|nr:MAG: DedA family protein [Calditrichota bacterium]
MTYPYLTLLASSFLAATILPFSSEALLLFLVEKQFNIPALLLTASIGNIGGALVNYYLGRLGSRKALHTWLRMDDTAIQNARRRYNKWGVWSLLLAWVPVIGDPLTVAAGLFGTSFPLFLLLVTLSKAGRYIFLVYLWGWF